MSAMRKSFRLLLLVAVVLLLAPSPAFAYIGPGAGFALAGSFFAVFAAVFSAFVTLLTWPVRLVVADAVRPGGRWRRAGSSGW